MTFETIPADQVARPGRALPFWLSLGLVPVAVLAALQGGWTIALVPLASWGLFTVLDAVEGVETANADPTTPDSGLVWYRAITLIWFPVQLALLCWLLWYVPQADHLGRAERIWLFFGMGVVSGTIGINYSHELMHQKSRAGAVAGRPAAGERALFAFPVGASARASHLGRHAARSGDGAL